MKNYKAILVTTIFIVTIGGVVAFVLGSSEDPLTQVSNKQSPELTQTRQEAQQANGAQSEKNSSYIIPGYVEYDATTVAATSGTRVLFFHAAWCPICKTLEKNILEEGVPEGLTIFKANYDTDIELRKQYGVSAVSSLVQIDDSGNLVKKWSGSLTIQQVIDQLI